MLLRDILINPRLLNILSAIESVFGYSITCEEMPLERQNNAICSIVSDQNGQWVLQRISAEPACDATICHELSHLILLLEGWPGFGLNLNLPPWDFRVQTLSMLANLALHVEVWPLVKFLGFDETPVYQDVEKVLIPQVKDQTLPQRDDIPPPAIQDVRAAYIAQGLLCPVGQDIKDQLRAAAHHTMPQALEAADSMCQAFEKRKPLAPLSCQEALHEVFAIIGAQKEILRVLFSDIVIPDFRGRILCDLE